MSVYECVCVWVSVSTKVIKKKEHSQTDSNSAKRVLGMRGRSRVANLKLDNATCATEAEPTALRFSPSWKQSSQWS